MTEDNNTRPPTGTPVSENKSSDDSLLENPTTESEGDFSLMMLMMGRPIYHILILIFHHLYILHVHIIIKRDIYLERELKLILSANTRAKNGLKQFGNKETMGK